MQSINCLPKDQRYQQRTDGNGAPHMRPIQAIQIRSINNN